MKVLALDYGSARTGVAVSDPSGTLARPLCVVEKVGARAAWPSCAAIIEREAPGVVVVGLPLTLRGERDRRRSRPRRSSLDCAADAASRSLPRTNA